MPRFITAAVLLACFVIIVALPQPPLSKQSIPDVPEYASAAAHLVHGDGYEATVPDPLAARLPNGAIVPRYPPGFSLVLAAFPAGFRGHGVPKLIMILVVAAVWLLATRLGGPTAGSIAAVLVVFAPFTTGIGMFLMSDAFTALLALAALLAVGRHPRASGFLAGYSILVRLASVPILLASVAAAERGRRLDVARWSLPPIICLLAFQWHTLGSPFSTGYRSVGAASFSLHYVTRHLSSGVVRRPVPNYLYYPGVLAGWFREILPPFVPILGLVEAGRRRHEAVARFFVVLAAGTLAVYLAYFFRDSRFMAPVGMLELALAGVLCGRLIGYRPGSRGIEPHRDVVAPVDPPPAIGSAATASAARPRP